MNTHIKSSEYAWHHTEVKIAGKIISGITSWELRKSTEKEALYGAGQHALDIQSGNIACSGSITLWGFEADRLEQAAQTAGYESIMDVPHELLTIVVSARKLAKDPITTWVASGVSFSETVDSLSQGDKKRECQLPFICMDINKNTISL
ncbi:MAG: hypothetical protein IKN59_07705 [Paludibacteraceae bacterium]|nr:hypothetical protein [Paludibacteraceae bacterium]